VFEITCDHDMSPREGRIFIHLWKEADIHRETGSFRFAASSERTHFPYLSKKRRKDRRLGGSRWAVKLKQHQEARLEA
jgi:hypothetical protein